MEWLNLTELFENPEAQVALFGILGLVLVILVRWMLKAWSDKVRLDRSLHLIFLEVKMPRWEEKKEGKNEEKMKDKLKVSEQFFKVLHGAIPKEKGDFLVGKQDFGLEMVAKNGELRFFFAVPHKMQEMVEKQITSFFPEAVVERTSDPNIFAEKNEVAVGWLGLKKEGFLPIRTFDKMEFDPLNNLTNVFSKLSEDEGATLQILIRPAGEKWRKKGKARARAIFEGKKEQGMLMKLLQGTAEKEEGRRVTPQEEERVKAIEGKANEEGFECVVRLICAAGGKERAEANLKMIANSFTQFAEPDLNEFKLRVPSGLGLKKKVKKMVESYLLRFSHEWGSRMILGPAELASVFHLPDPELNKAPVIKWQNAKVAAAPANLPKEGIVLGDNVHRGERKEVRMKNEDRMRHFYMVGQTGMGKSVALTNMILQDMKEGKGICVMDPHGSLAKDVLEFVPRERAEDVIYFNAADTERPMGLNLLEAETDDEKDLVTLEALNIMIKLFGEEIFSPRLQDYFRNGVLTLLDDEEEGGTIVDVVSLFTNLPFQKYKRGKVKNPIVKDWWNNTYDKMGAREKEEIIPYFASKFGAFVTNTTMRNIIGQSKSAFDFGRAMQEGKIILVNLSKGMIGDLNSDLLGMIVVSKIQQAAMRRERMAKGERKDFFFYIDEFQNFITDSIENILSEARKYRLGMVMAHQYIAQLEDHEGFSKTGDKVRKAVFGNVGTIWSYKVGAEDAEFLEKEFKPVFGQRDLNNLDMFNAAIKMTIDGVQTPPFSITTRKYWEDESVVKNPEKITEAIKELSRLQWGRDKKFVEGEILGRLGI